MNARLVNAAADVIARAKANGRQTPAGLATALDSAQLLQSPETAAELEQLRARVDEVERKYTFDTAELKRQLDAALARVAELEHKKRLEDRERVELLTGLERALAPFCVDAKAAAVAAAEVRHCEAEWLLRDAQRSQDRVTELEAERHSTNEALDDAVRELRARRDDEPAAPYISRPLPPRDAVCARPGCGHTGVDHHHGDTKCWANLPRTRQRNGAWSAVSICGCSGFVAETGGAS